MGRIQLRDRPLADMVNRSEISSTNQREHREGKMNFDYKGCLSRYCQQMGLSPPLYYYGEEFNSLGSPIFRAQVAINGVLYLSNELCISKKKAEQAAAMVALQSLKIYPFSERNHHEIRPVQNHPAWNLHRDDISEPVLPVSDQHSFSALDGLGKMISDMIRLDQGNVQKVTATVARGKFKIEVSGTYNSQVESNNSESVKQTVNTDPISKETDQEIVKSIFPKSRRRKFPKSQNYRKCKRINRPARSRS